MLDCRKVTWFFRIRKLFIFLHINNFWIYIHIFVKLKWCGGCLGLTWSVQKYLILDISSCIIKDEYLCFFPSFSGKFMGVLSSCVLIRDDGRTVQWRIKHMIQQIAVLADIYTARYIICSVYSVGAVQRELINLGCFVNIGSSLNFMWWRITCITV